jgi:predicted GIY-YIG superfamily endonuclease
MIIDNYNYSDEHLWNVDLPQYLTLLEQNIEDPIPMSRFNRYGVGVATLVSELGVEKDFPGCYLLIDVDTPIYVGISKKVLNRLRQHVRGNTHFDASLAYKMASAEYSHNFTRQKAMENEIFITEFNKAKKMIKGFNVAFVKIENPLVLYFFEPLCAMKFKTGKWNTFETH